MIEESRPLNWEEKVGVCQQWQASGLSMSKFCKQKSLAMSTFSGWCRRLWPSKRKSKFCKVQITGLNSAPAIESVSTPMLIELSFGHNVTARVEAIGSQISLLLQELVHATTTIR
jgi:hypothetical protein